MCARRAGKCLQFLLPLQHLTPTCLSKHAHYPPTPVSQPNRRSEAARRIWERRRQAQASAAASSNGAQTPNEGQVGFRVTSRELGGADRRSATTSDCFTRLELNQ
ncbi:hypothetical protein DFP72DRAFT_136777 [Ephemerocybe angulata]|uniref:Uncharacterized protein n=1 Tax=Ephemerocybe angulata TaxID=980116 RepID=A0A8H6I8Q9_9AGAR|nr:hypothetical protein DFP72DRAFT_136777 [Tulosesus angulatus]